MIFDVDAHRPCGGVRAQIQSVRGISRVQLDLREGVADGNIQTRQPLLLGQGLLLVIEEREGGGADGYKNSDCHQQLDERKAPSGGKTKGASRLNILRGHGRTVLI